MLYQLLPTHLTDTNKSLLNMEKKEVNSKQGNNKYSKEFQFINT